MKIISVEVIKNDIVTGGKTIKEITLRHLFKTYTIIEYSGDSLLLYINKETDKELLWQDLFFPFKLTGIHIRCALDYFEMDEDFIKRSEQAKEEIRELYEKPNTKA